MIPRTDQFIECSDGSLEIRGVAQPLDLLTYLLNKLDAFLGVCDTLPRGADGAYLARDPRAGKIGSVRSSLEHVQMAAQVVHSTTLVPFSLRQTASDIAIAELAPTAQAAHIADLARQLIFTVLRPEAESAIPAASIDRLRKMRDRLEALVMPTQTEAMRALQADFHHWVRETPGARDWLAHEIVPQLEAEWSHQRDLRRRQEAAEGPVRERWRRARDSGTPFDERLPVVYERDLDPRHMSAATIGRLRDEGRGDQADLAEAYFVLMLHDSGEAGNLDKLCPLIGRIEGIERPFDWAYLDRAGTGLERDDTPPRFTPDAAVGMVARLKKRFEVGPRAEQLTGFTLKDIRETMGLKSHSAMQAIFKAAGLKQPESGDGHQKFGAATIRALIAFCRHNCDARRRRYAPLLEELLREIPSPR